MSTTTAIEWADSTWNPWRGCIEVSDGCLNCYARTYAERYGQPWAFTRAAKATFNAPLTWRPMFDERGDYRPRRIFTCSLSDFFAREADEWRAEAWDIIRHTPQHTYLILTKRPWNIRTRLPADWGAGWPNVWLGVTAEDQQHADLRTPALAKIPAVVRFVSLEPMLGEIDLLKFLGYNDMSDEGRFMPRAPEDQAFQWAIAGGESGALRRTCEVAWFQSAADQCAEADVAFFVKQDGGAYPGKQGRIPDALWARKAWPEVRAQ